MDSQRKIENLSLVHGMCTREAKSAKQYISSISTKMDFVYNHVRSALEENKENCLRIYDKALTDISHLSDLLRKFNLKCETSPFCANMSLEESDEEDVYLPCVKGNHDKFSYSPVNLSKYSANYESECVITYIKNCEELLFYMNEKANSSSENFVSNLQSAYIHDLETSQYDPKEGEVFGLILEGYVFRAVRENGSSSTSCNVCLIDVGEIINFSTNMQTFPLLQEHQEAPSQAVLCKLESVNYYSDLDLKEYLKKSLYVKHIFKVHRVSNSILYVDLCASTNPFRHADKHSETSLNDNENDSSNGEITNPFHKYSPKPKPFVQNLNENTIAVSHQIVKSYPEIKLNDLSSVSNHWQNPNGICTYDNIPKIGNAAENLKEFLSLSNESYADNVDNSNNMNDEDKYVNDGFKYELSEEQRKILYSEPLNTNNAMVAVMGYNPQDDKRICPYTKPGTDSCFKGSSCKLEHVQKIKEGWTRDQAETIVDIPNKITYPVNGSMITILPTHIINVEYFFGQIQSKDSKYRRTINEIILKMNSVEEMTFYQKLKEPPSRFEFVIAKYKDQRWYRAKVINVYDDNTVKVFYVDYGNSDILELDALRKWETKFFSFPFQAVPFRLSGIKQIQEKEFEGVEYLRRTILNKKVKADIVNNEDQLEAQIIDLCGHDVAETLIRLGLAEPESGTNLH